MPVYDRTVPQASLSVFDAIIIMVGLVVGIGIFRTPSHAAGEIDQFAQIRREASVDLPCRQFRKIRYDT